MLYFDTSFLTLRPTGGRERAERAIHAASDRRRLGGQPLDDARTIDAAFDTMIDASFVVLLPCADDFRRAREYLAHHRTGLRAGDALHLAIAGNRQVDTIFSLDNTFISAGKVLGLPVSRGI